MAGMPTCGLADGIERTLTSRSKSGWKAMTRMWPCLSRRIRCGRHEVEIRHKPSAIQSTQVIR